MNHIICIERQFGSGGRTIAKKAAEKQLILQVARQGDCVIVGRCASHILRKGTGHHVLHIFIAAPMAYRIERVMERERLGQTVRL